MDLLKGRGFPLKLVQVGAETMATGCPRAGLGFRQVGSVAVDVQDHVAGTKSHFTVGMCSSIAQGLAGSPGMAEAGVTDTELFRRHAPGFWVLLAAVRESVPQPNNPPAKPPIANLLREPQSRQQQANWSKTRSAGGQLEHSDDCLTAGSFSQLLAR
jgi:hypothetical protein